MQISELLFEFASGALFAVGLFSSGVYLPEVIKAQFSFTSNVMITTMMAASACSAIVMDLVDRFGVMKMRHSAPSTLGFFAYDGNILGGLLLGLGMAVTGSCPGTSFVQAGTGNLNGVLVIIGGLLGAITFVKLQERARAQMQDSKAQHMPNSEISDAGSKTPLDIATALGISPLVLLLIWVPMCLAVMKIAFAKDRLQPHLMQPGLVPPAYGGLVIGLAQLATVYLTGHAVGASAGYEDVVRWFEGKLRRTSNVDSSRTLFTGSVVFSAGIVCSAAVLNHLLHGPVRFHGVEIETTASILRAVAGGWSMVLGARIARGCTSGHGISGLSKFSLPSLVSTAAMFGMGIATAGLLE